MRGVKEKLASRDGGGRTKSVRLGESQGGKSCMVRTRVESRTRERQGGESYEEGVTDTPKVKVEESGIESTEESVTPGEVGRTLCDIGNWRGLGEGARQQKKREIKRVPNDRLCKVLNEK